MMTSKLILTEYLDLLNEEEFDNSAPASKLQQITTRHWVIVSCDLDMILIPNDFHKWKYP